jgi:hypothetical protein
MPIRRPRLLGRFHADQSAIAAVEFALVVPVMILFSMGVAEVGRFALLNLKLQHAATTVADLAARDESVSDDAMTSIMGAMDFVVRPFDLDTQGLVIVSCVGPDGGGDPTVLAQAEGGGALDETSAIGSLDGVATLPDDLILRDGERVVVAEAIFRYTPWLLELVPETLLRRIAFYRPRLATGCPFD